MGLSAADTDNWVQVGWQDSTGKQLVLLVDYGVTVKVYSMSGYSSLNSNIASINIDWPMQDFWVGLRNDGTNYYLEMSRDGVNFFTIYSSTLSGAYLADFGNIYFGQFTSSSTGSGQAMTLRCWDTAGLTRSFP